MLKCSYCDGGIKSLRVPSHFSSGQFSRVQLFVTPWIAACQASVSIINSRVHPDSRPLSQWCHPAISSSVIPFSSCPQSLPASESFQWVNSLHEVAKVLEFQLQPSVLPMNTQDWSPLGWTCWISLQSKELSRVFSTPQFKSINSLALSFLHSLTFTSILDHWKNQSLD